MAIAPRFGRRSFLALAAGGAGAIGGATLLARSALTRPRASAPSRAAARVRASGGRLELDLVAQETAVAIPGGPASALTYNGLLPGPLLESSPTCEHLRLCLLESSPTGDCGRLSNFSPRESGSSRNADAQSMASILLLTCSKLGRSSASCCQHCLIRSATTFGTNAGSSGRRPLVATESATSTGVWCGNGIE